MIEDQLESPEGFSRKVAGYEKPTCMSELKKIVSQANKNNFKLYPISCGKNWGYGTNLPTLDNNIIVDLSSLNEILEINLDEGYAIIGPGVTQWDLYHELKDTDYYFDVTGSGAKTSIIGNIAEKGIGYHFQRTDLVNALEVLLASGEILRTGHWGISDCKIGHIYSKGIGPSLEGLFYQSNMGIITKASVKLIQRADVEKSFSLALPDEKFQDAVTSVARLKKAGVIFGISHMASRERFISTAAPLLYRHLKEKKELERFNQIIKNQLHSDWYIVGKIQGKNTLVNSAAKEIKKELGRLSKIYFLDKEETLLKNKVFSWFLGKERRFLLEAIKGLRQLNFGIPSDEGIFGATWDKSCPNILNNCLQSEKYGWIFCTLLAPLNAHSAEIYRDVSERVSSDFGLVSAMTLNFLSDRILEAVISLKFDKNRQKGNRAPSLC